MLIQIGIALFSKHISLVIIPRKTSKVRKIKVPLFVIGLAGVILLALLAGFTYVVMDYLSLRTQLASMEKDQELFDQQQIRIDDFNRQYQDLELHFDNLSSLNEQLKSMVITNIDTERKIRLRKEKQEAMAEKIEIASKSTVLEVIASNQSELDSELKLEQELIFNNLVSFFGKRQNPFTRIPSGLPVDGYLIGEFGMHTDPYTGQVRPQNGIDIAARLDSPVLAPADALVIDYRTDEEYGLLLVLDHGNGIKTQYGHLSGLEVEKGDFVNKGDVVALVGNTGKTTGPRLYYEVSFNGVPQNPVKYSYD